MEEAYYIGAYWGVRQESAAQSAERALHFFHELKQCDSSFERWYLPARKYDRSLPGIPLNTADMAELEQVFQRGRNRANVNRTVIEELGFHLDARNQKKETTNLSIINGVYSPYSSNLCLMTLPNEGPSAERLLHPSVLTRVIGCMVTVWDPAYGLASTNNTILAAPNPNERDANVGWLTYLSRRQGRVPPLPAPVRIERLGDKGTLITLTPERFTASNPEHLALLVRVRELLDRAGVLKGFQA